MIYFCLLLPWKCHDESLYFDTTLSLNVGIVTSINAAMIYVFYVFKYRGFELNLQAKALGYWKRIRLEETGR
jgi:hypothetical protein